MLFQPILGQPEPAESTLLLHVYTEMMHAIIFFICLKCFKGIFTNAILEGKSPEKDKLDSISVNENYTA